MNEEESNITRWNEVCDPAADVKAMSKEMENRNEDRVVSCTDGSSGRDNIEKVENSGNAIAIYCDPFGNFVQMIVKKM